MSCKTKNTPSKLLDQVHDRIRVKHYSIRTETQYMQWIKRFIQRHPQEMGIAKVEVAVEPIGSALNGAIAP